MEALLTLISGELSELESISQEGVPGVLTEASKSMPVVDANSPTAETPWLSSYAAAFDREPIAENKFRKRLDAIIREFEKQKSMLGNLLPFQVNVLFYIIDSIYLPLEKLLDTVEADKDVENEILGRLVFLETLYEIKKSVTRGEDARRSFGADFLQEIAKRQEKDSHDLQKRKGRIDGKMAEEATSYSAYIDGDTTQSYSDEKLQMMRFITRQFANIDTSHPQAAIVLSLLEKVLNIQDVVYRDTEPPVRRAFRGAN